MNRAISLLAAIALVLAASGSTQANGSHGVAVHAVQGAGDGIVNLTTTAGQTGFSAEITVNVHGMIPGTVLYVERAPEVGRPLGHDGNCQRADGQWPWEQPSSLGFPPAPAFVPFPRPLVGPLETLTASDDGAGALHFAFDLPFIADGTQFDVEFRLVDSLTNPSIELRSDCFTVTVK